MQNILNDLICINAHASFYLQKILINAPVDFRLFLNNYLLLFQTKNDDSNCNHQAK